MRADHRADRLAPDRDVRRAAPAGPRSTDGPAAGVSWTGRLRGALWATLVLAFALGGAVPSLARARAVSVFTDQLAGPQLMGLGVELDPYDSFQPTPTQWDLTFQRLDFMRPGFLRVVEPSY